MAAVRWGVVQALVVIIVVISGCSEGPAPLEMVDARVAQSLVSAAVERFEVLAPQVKRARPLEPVAGGFRSAPVLVDNKSGGMWRKPGNHRLVADLPGKADGVMRLSNGPVTLEVWAMGASGAQGVVSEGALVYADAYPHADSVILAERERVEEFIVLRDRRAPRTFAYELRVVRGGGQVRQQVGTVEVLDREGNAWLRLAAPWVQDAEGKKHEVAAKLEGERLTLTVPRAARQYPLLLDPGWVTTGEMIALRMNHTDALLLSGKVLVMAGGTASAELYDLKTGTWTGAGGMSSSISSTATLLPSGKVLSVGNASTAVDLYNPATGKWTVMYSPSYRSYNTATLLKTGKVLVAGAQGSSNSADLYDYKTNTWAVTGKMVVGRYVHTATLLQSGKVLVAGGKGTTSYLTAAELYDPATGTWAATGSMASGRQNHTATLLPTGKVLVVGGDVGTKSVELYDPKTGTWSKTGSLTFGRANHTATLLKSGKVLAAGAGGTYPQFPSAELYDPATGTWSKTGDLRQGHSGHTATLFNSGMVLVAGGTHVSYGFKGTAELYHPTSGLACTSASECVTGYCADGICCETACDGTCKVCTVTGDLGVCGNVALGKQDKSAKVPCVASGKACDGKGNCQLANGASCTLSSSCGSGSCVDGVCCDKACAGACQSCNQTGSVGKCMPIASGQDSLCKGTCEECLAGTCTKIAAGKQHSLTCSATGKACDGKGNCLSSDGQSCTSSTNCASGYCADYICCDTACSGSCLACNLSGKLGKCSYVPAEKEDASAASPCTSPKACDGKGQCLLARGKGCSLGAACSTGFCMDYVCCNTACTDTCKSCSLSGTVGTCSLVPAGITDSNATKQCTGNQVCDGKGGCFAAKGQACKVTGDCASGYCVDGVCCTTTCTDPCKTCALPGAKGTCAALPAGKVDLNAKPPCQGTQACDGAGTCRAANGQYCSLTSSCASGFCADNTCCDSLCKGTCKSCKVKGSVGKCDYLPLGQQDANATMPCTGYQACDGKGLCMAAKGQKCKSGSECATGTCADGVCCDTACTDTCKSCALTGSIGTCSFIPAGVADTSPAGTCTGDKACNGSGFCKAAVGQACADNKDCANSTCADKVCCGTKCADNCMSCNLSGKVGTCTYDSVGTKSPDCIGKDKDCGGTCDGKGTCDYPAATKTCGSGKCMACDGKGDCNRPPRDDSVCGTIDCDKLDTKCRDYHDLTTERCDSFGKCKPANDTKSCTLYTDLPCSDAGGDSTPKREAGPGADQGPGKTEPDEEGCSCEVGGADPPGASLLILIAVVALLRRRRS